MPFATVEQALETLRSGKMIILVDDEWRCDLHPRVSPDGRLITIDSPHGGDGRQMYLIDVGTLVNSH